MYVLVAGMQDSSYSDQLKSLHIELRKKHKAGELDGYCLYVYVMCICYFTYKSMEAIYI